MAWQVSSNLFFVEIQLVDAAEQSVAVSGSIQQESGLEQETWQIFLWSMMIKKLPNNTKAKEITIENLMILLLDHCNDVWNVLIQFVCDVWDDKWWSRDGLLSETMLRSMRLNISHSNQSQLNTSVQQIFIMLLMQVNQWFTDYKKIIKMSF